VFALMGRETIGYVESEKRRSSGTDTAHSVQWMRIWRGAKNQRASTAGTAIRI